MLPDEPNVLNLETHRQFLNSAQSLRDLADALAYYSQKPDAEKLGQLSRQLAHMGWNALFTSILLAELQQKLWPTATRSGFHSAEQLFQEIDSLLTATNYLQKHIKNLVRVMKTHSLIGENVHVSLAQLANRLKEVARECRPQ